MPGSSPEWKQRQVLPKGSKRRYPPRVGYYSATHGGVGEQPNKLGYSPISTSGRLARPSIPPLFPSFIGAHPVLEGHLLRGCR